MTNKNNYKTYQLIVSMTEKERKTFLSFSAQLLNVNQIKIVQFIVKAVEKNENFEYDVLYTKIFKTTYTPKKEIYLKNELKYINQIIKHFFIYIETAKSENNRKNGEYEYVISLLNRGLHSLFEKEIKSILDDIILNEDYDNFCRFFFLYTQYNIQYAKIDKSSYENIYHDLLENSTYIQRAIAATYLQYDTFVKMLECSISIFKKIEPVSVEERFSTQQILSIQTPVIQFKKAKRDSYSIPMIDRIAANEQKLNLLEQIKSYTISSKEEKMVSHANLFTYYSLLGQFDKAIEIGDSVIDNIDEFSPFVKPYVISGFIFNFITTNLRVFNIQRATYYFNIYEKQLLASNLVNRVYMQKFFIKLFEKKFDEAYQVLNKIDFNTSAIDKILIKIFETILFIEENDILSASNFIINIKQSIYYNELKDDLGFFNFIKKIEQLIDLMVSSNSKNNKFPNEFLSEINTEFKQLQTSSTSFLMPFVWLKYYVNNFNESSQYIS